MSAGPERFRLLATFVAGRSVEVAHATDDDVAHTDGDVVFVSRGASDETQRRQVLLQSALLGAGSLNPAVLQALRHRSALTQRYLSIEGQRVLTALVTRVPFVEGCHFHGAPLSTSTEESLRLAGRRGWVAAPPPWFGTVKNATFASPPRDRGSSPTDEDLRLSFAAGAESADDAGPSERSRILKLFQTPIASELVANLFRTLLGMGRSPGEASAGAALRTGSVQRAQRVSPQARPAPTRIQFTDAPGKTVGVGGAWYPEWDVYANRYRPDWCRVVDFPLVAATTAADVADSAVRRDDELRRRLSRISLGQRMLRARTDGDELDLERLVDLCVDVRSGHSGREHVYIERRRTERNLGVLILVDASGSATDTDARGRAVHDHQLSAAATIAATLEELGDRVAVHAFRSRGRHAVHLPAIKTFHQRFGAAGRARLNNLEPSGYTRLGAGIRGAGALLQRESGTPVQLLLLLSDGFPYDDGYEGRYAEADAARALEELRADGVACLCLSLGALAEAPSLKRVFGAASHASGASLADLSPRMDELFGLALAEVMSTPG